MKVLKAISAIVGISLLFASCKNNMDLTKRHYTKGYYFHKSKSFDRPADEGVAVNSGAVNKSTPDNMEIITPKAFSSNPEKEIVLKKQSGATAIEKHKAAVFNTQQRATSLSHKSFQAVQQKNAMSARSNSADSAKGHSGNASDVGTVLLIVLCILLPPLAVYLKEDDINVKFWIDLLLCILFWLPGIIYAFYVCFA